MRITEIDTQSDSEEDFIPASPEIPRGALSPWLIAALLLIAAFVALGFWSQHLQDGPLEASTIMRGAYASVAFNWVFALIPQFSALVMIWLAFARPGWSDRFLWSAAMILTANELASLAALLFPSASSTNATLHLYPLPHAVLGIVAYSSWLLIVDRSAMESTKKQILGLLCIIALLIIAAFPLINPYMRFIDIAGSFLFAGVCLALGKLFADKVGVDLLRRDEDQATEDAAS